MSKRFDAAVGIASGLAQGTTIVHAQIIVVIAVSLGVPPQTLAWVAPISARWSTTLQWLVAL